MLLTGSLGILIALISYCYGTALERDLEAREFERLAQVQYQNTQELLRRSTLVLLAFRGFFTVAPQIDREEYARFAATILPHHPEVFAVHWAPRIDREQRAAFEARIRDLQPVPLGLFNVDISARQPRPAAPRGIFLPVLYSAPLAANLKVIGLDTLEQPSNHATILDAITRNSPRITPVFPLYQDPDGPLAAALFQPVFSEGMPLVTPEQRWQALKGFLILMLRPGLLLQDLPFGELKVDLRLYDLQDERAVAIHPRGATLLPPARNVVHHELHLPGRTWVMEFVARDGFGKRIHLQPLLLMLTLLLLTLVCLLFLHRSQHAARALHKANLELLRRQQVLDDLAHQDPLTGLANRLQLRKRLELALVDRRSNGRRLAVCLMDLDGFKEINDRFGHAAGDLVLREVADRLREVVRSSDTVARLGGDEFVLLLPGMCRKAVPRLMQQLLERIRQPIALGQHGPQAAVSASIGIAFADDRQDIDTLLHRADAAMYQAKSAGKGCYRTFTADSDAHEPASS